jgi:hypothetical protein
LAQECNRLQKQQHHHQKLHVQVYQFTNGQETYLVEARNVFGARQKLEDKGVDPGYFTLVSIEWGDEFPTD